MIYAILIGYIVLVFWSSLWTSSSSENTPESYFLAGRNVKTIRLFFTILATNFSAFYFLGFAGEGYRIGYAHYSMMAIGSIAALAFIIIGERAWALAKEHNYFSPAELIYGGTQNRPLAMLFSGVMIIFTLPYLALQIIGGGYILEGVTDGEISYSLAICLLTFFTIVYVILGGMQSVSKTDVKQGLLMIIFMFLAVATIAFDLGGISEANERAFIEKPALFLNEGVDQHFTPKKWFSFIVFWFFCIPMFPQLFMRFYIAKDKSHLRTSALLYACVPLVISILPVMIGVWGHISFPGLEGKEADQILPMMLAKHSYPWISALVMTGAIAAFMSTLDSQLLALSTMIIRDFYHPFVKEKPSFSKEVFIGKCLVGIIASIGLLIAFTPFDTIFDMGKMAFTGLAILFPVSLAVTRFKLHKPILAIIGICLSLLGLLGFHYGWIPVSLAFGFEPFVWLISLSFALTWLGVSRR